MVFNNCREILDYLNELDKINNFKLDVREASPMQRAYNLAVIITYGRCFGTNFNFKVQLEKKYFIAEFDDEEKAMDKKILDLRNEQFAHADATPFDHQYHTEGIFAGSNSICAVMQVFAKIELKTLRVMVEKVIDKARVARDICNFGTLDEKESFNSEMKKIKPHF